MANYKVFETLATQLFVKTANTWQGDPENLRNYSVGWLAYKKNGPYSIGHIHNHAFFNPKPFMDIADVCDLKYYFTIGENEDGVTVILRVF